MSTPAIPQDLQLNPEVRGPVRIRGEARGVARAGPWIVCLRGRGGRGDGMAPGKAVRAAGLQTGFPRPQPPYGCVRSPHGALAPLAAAFSAFMGNWTIGVVPAVVLVYGLSVLRES